MDTDSDPTDLQLPDGAHVRIVHDHVAWPQVTQDVVQPVGLAADTGDTHRGHRGHRVRQPCSRRLPTHSVELLRAWRMTIGSVRRPKWVWPPSEVGGAGLRPPSSLNCSSACASSCEIR